MNYQQVVAKRRRNLFLKAGVPMIAMIVAGSVFLSNFVATQVEMKDKNEKAINERQFDIEEEHRKLLKRLDIDNFTLSRIPRPEELAEKEKNNKK